MKLRGNRSGAEGAPHHLNRAFAAQTRLPDRTGNGLSHSHIVNLAAGRELPSRRVLKLLASASGIQVLHRGSAIPLTAPTGRRRAGAHQGPSATASLRLESRFRSLT